MIEISAALNDARLAGVVAFLASGTSAEKMMVYDGARPAFGATPTGILLVEIALLDPFGTILDGVLTVAPPPPAMILATGVATWARVVNGADVIGWDWDVSDAAGSGNVKLDSVTLFAGGFASIISGVLT
ncbi:MAG: hypothetical protein IPP91_17605 [Betaproteobacteria bacterium]|nr:hypothetical protein [Betaproteobacteria bacterium]